MATPMETMGKVLDALLEELRRDGTDKDLCSKTIMPGDVTIADYGAESCGGMAWLRLINANTTVSFPTSDVTVNNCTHLLAFNAELGVLRPAKLPDNNGVNEFDLPSDTEQWDEADLQLKDMAAMHRALKKVGQEMDDFIIRAYAPNGPDGGVVGGIWSFVFGEE